MEDKIVYRELSYRLVGLAIQVRKELGFGFLEKVYENALIILLRENCERTVFAPNSKFL